MVIIIIQPGGEVLERGFITIDQGEITNLCKYIYGMGFIGYDKVLFVAKFADLLVIG